MAWFGTKISDFRNQISAFTKEVLAEDQNAYHAIGEVLHPVSGGSVLSDEPPILPSKFMDLTVSGGGGRPQVREAPEGGELAPQSDSATCNDGLLQHTHIGTPLSWLAGKPQWRQFSSESTTDSDAMVQHLQQQLHIMEEEKEKLTEKCDYLQNQAYHLHQNAHAEVDILTQKLNESENHVLHLESELKSSQEKRLVELNNSQLSTSELRDEIGETRRKLTETTRNRQAHISIIKQGIVNLIMNTYEEQSQSQHSIEDLEREGQNVTGDILKLISQLGDNEQQELVQGAIQALELENRVLRSRNMKLESAESSKLVVSVPSTSICDGFDDLPKQDIHSTLDDVAEANNVELNSIKEDIQSLKEEKSMLQSNLEEMDQQNTLTVAQLGKLRDTVHKQSSEIQLLKLDLQQSTLQSENLQLSFNSCSNELQNKNFEISKLLSKWSFNNINELEKALHDNKANIEELSATVRRFEDVNAKETVELETLLGEHNYPIQSKLKIIEVLLTKNYELERVAKDISQDNDSFRLQFDKLVPILGCNDVRECVCDITHKVRELEFLKEEKCNNNSKLSDWLKDHNLCEDLSIINALNIVDQLRLEAIESERSMEGKLTSGSDVEQKDAKAIGALFKDDMYVTIRDLTITKKFESLIKLHQEEHWKRETLERRVAELCRELRESGMERSKLQNEVATLRESVQRLRGIVGTRTGDTLAPIPEEDGEDMDQSQVGNQCSEQSDKSKVPKTRQVNYEDKATQHIYNYHDAATSCDVVVSSSGSQCSPECHHKSCDTCDLPQSDIMQNAEAMTKLSQLVLEREQMLAVLGEKSRKNATFKSENRQLMDIVAAEKSALAKLQEENTALGKSEEATSQKLQEVSGLLTEHKNNIMLYKQHIDQLEEKLRNCKNVENQLQQDKHELQLKIEMFGNHIIAQQNQLVSEEVEKQIFALNEQLQLLEDDNAKHVTMIQLLENEVTMWKDKVVAIDEDKSHLGKELVRLRAHLLEMEDNYTGEAVAALEREDELKKKNDVLQERFNNEITEWPPKGIGTVTMGTLQQRLEYAVMDKNTLLDQLQQSEDKVQQYAAALSNLQDVLEQFQRDRAKDLLIAEERLQSDLTVEKMKNEELQVESESLKLQLNHAKDGLAAASRISEQLNKKSDVITTLRIEVQSKQDELLKVLEKLKNINTNQEGKVDSLLQYTLNNVCSIL